MVPAGFITSRGLVLHAVFLRRFFDGWNIPSKNGRVFYPQHLYHLYASCIVVGLEARTTGRSFTYHYEYWHGFFLWPNRHSWRNLDDDQSAFCSWLAIPDKLLPDQEVKINDSSYRSSNFGNRIQTGQKFFL